MTRVANKIIFALLTILIFIIISFFISVTSLRSHEERIHSQINLFKDEIINAVGTQDTYTLRRFSESFLSNDPLESISFISGFSPPPIKSCFIKRSIPVNHMGIELGYFEVCKTLSGVLYQVIKNSWFFTISIIFVFIFTASYFLPVLIYRRTIKNILEAVSAPNIENEFEHRDDVQKKLISILDHNINQKISFENSKTIAMLAQQVSHDIRSPLSALNMILQNLNQVPEEKRLIIRNAVERINDIANTLLSKAKNLNASNSIEGRFSNVNFLSESSDLIVELIPALVDILISEKRIQFRESFNVQISSDLQGSYGAFASINPLEFKRMLSNLINNSFESFELRGGKIHVSVLAKSRDVEIIIKDTGKGIPDHILKKIGEPGVTFGKSAESKSGTGLGLYHAKKTVEKFGGELLISSELGQGTTVKISLPKSNPPKWFVSELRLVANQTIVVLDDDISIHSIWKGRLESLNAKTHNINLVGFTSAIEFKNWVLALPIQTKVLFLIDYELINQSQTGLDLIEELKISAYLVTSRFEEKSILERCERLNLCLIPKSMASLLPIKISEAPILFDWILIDDDPLVHMTWDLAAKNYEKRFRGYFNFQDFEQNKNSFDFNSTIYIDANLSDNVRGEDVAESIFALGFINIFIATGYPEDQIKQSNFIKAVVGKNPPI